MTNETIGKITSIDLQKGSLVLDSWDGKYMITHPFHIIPELDVVLRKQKLGYFVQITHDGELARNIKYAPKPADWPQSKQYPKPRNEGLIVYQTVYKECCETVRSLMLIPDGVLDETEFNRLMDIALSRALKDGKALIEAGDQK